jgi:hypothetical protein
LIVRYEVNGVSVVCNKNHFTYNGKQAWHRIGKPEFPHPPDFVVPDDLLQYLADVGDGKYGNKTLQVECEKMGLVIDGSETTPADQSLGVVLGSSHRPVVVDATLQTLDVRRETLDSQTGENGLQTLSPTSPPEGKTGVQADVNDAVSERVVERETKKISEAEKKRRAEMESKERVRKSTLEERLMKLSVEQRDVFLDLVSFMEGQRKGKHLTVSQQLGYLDVYRAQIDNPDHDAARYLEWVREAMKKPSVDDPLKYAAGCMHRNGGEPLGAGGGNGWVAASDIDATYKAKCAEEDAALKAQDYGRQQQLAMELQRMREANPGRWLE